MTGHGHVVLVHEQKIALAVKLVVARQPHLPRVAAGVAAVETAVPATVNISYFAVVYQDAVYGVIPGTARLDVFGWSVAAARVGRGVLGKLADAIARHQQFEVFSRVADFRHYEVGVPWVRVALSRGELLKSLAKIGQDAVAHQRPVRLLGQCVCPRAFLQFHVALGQGLAFFLEVVIKVLERDAGERLVGGEPGLNRDGVQFADQDVALAVDCAGGGDDGRRHRAFARDVVRPARRGVFLERRSDPVGRIAARQGKVDPLKRHPAILVLHRVDAGPLRPCADRVRPDGPGELGRVTDGVLGVAAVVFHAHAFAVVAEHALVRTQHRDAGQAILLDGSQALGILRHDQETAALDRRPRREGVVDTAADPPVVQRDRLAAEIVQFDELVHILQQVEHRLASPVELRLLDRVVHDLGDHDARRWRCVGVHSVKPAKRRERFLERVRAGNFGVQIPRDFHLGAWRLGKRKPIPAVADLCHALCRLAIDQQVAGVHAADIHAELHLDRVE